jgi:hypothetical protein
MEQPPVLEASPEQGRKANLGRIGLCFSLAPLVMIGLMLLCQPG